MKKFNSQITVRQVVSAAYCNIVMNMLYLHAIHKTKQYQAEQSETHIWTLLLCIVDNSFRFKDRFDCI